MRRILLVVLSLLVIATALGVGQGTMIFNPPPLVVTEERLAYSVSPPRQITVAFTDASLLVNLKKEGQLQVVGSFPQAGSKYGVGGVLVNICSNWDLQGTYPGAIYYQVRPGTDLSNAWQNYALHFDVPSLIWGTPIGIAASIIPAARFGSMPMPSEKVAIDPAPSLELGPGGMKGTVQQPYQFEVTFPTVHLEWFGASQTARLRAGNIVLDSAVSWRWDPANPNAIFISFFHIDLITGIVTYYRTYPQLIQEQTLLQVTIDDGPSNVLYWEPYLWW